jgi:hypothetical protein
MSHNGRYQAPVTHELWSPTRREFLIRASSAADIAVGGLASIPVTAHTAHAQPAPQPDWPGRRMPSKGGFLTRPAVPG